MTADKEEQEETWQEFYEENRIIPPHSSREKQDGGNRQTFPFCLTLKSLEGVAVPGGVSTDTSEFQVLVTLYDAANNWFFGSTWKGPLLPATDVIAGKAKVQLNEPLYFHSTENDYTIVAIIEVAITDGAVYQSIGWASLRIFANVENLKDTKTKKEPLHQSLTPYYGTPAGLLLVPEPIEEFHALIPIPDCSIIYTLQSHAALEDVVHLIPENVFISGDDRIPGVSEVGADTGSGIVDILRKPKLQKAWPCYISKFSVFLHPSVDEFEEKLCLAINKDRLAKHGLQPDGSVVTVAERRLLIGVHNGWRFVKDHHIGYLQKEFAASTGSLREGQTKQCKSLNLRSRIELDEMINHPLFAIVFQIQYVVNIPVVQPELPTNKKAKSRTVGASGYGSMPLSQKQEIIARWLVWLPYENGPIENKEFTLQLTGCPVGNPANSLCFSKKLEGETEAQKSLGKIQFTFTQVQKKRGSIKRQAYLQPGGITSGNTSEASATFGQDIGTPQLIASTPLPTGRPPLPNRGVIHDGLHKTLKRKTKQLETDDEGLKGVSLKGVNFEISKFQRDEERSEGVTPIPAELPKPFTTSTPFVRPKEEMPDLSVLPNTQQYTPILATSAQQHLSTPSLSRVAYAALHSAGFPAIADSSGNPPFVVDPGELLRYKMEKEEGDVLQCNEIILQFMAMSLCKHPVTFFTFQFYRFPQVFTERMCLKDFASQQGQTVNVPCVLVKCDKDGQPKSGPPGLQIKYVVDPAYMQPGEKKSFMQYLLEQKLYIDVWSGDSLLLIGSTSVELKYLMRQGSSAVQASLELDVTSVEYSEDDSAMSGDLAQNGRRIPSGSKVTLEGKLYMKLANVGYTSDFNRSKAGTMPELKSTVIVPQLETTLGKTNGTSSALIKPKTMRAKLMTECDSELASLLFTRRGQTAPVEGKLSHEAEAIKKRKMERMQAVRQIQNGNVTNAFVLQKEEKVQRHRDLQTIQLYRDRCKHEGIINRLEDAITTRRTFHTSLGTAEFFEFALKNPYPTDQTVEISIKDRDLSVITDAREWKHFKQLTGTRTAMEENMINIVDTSIQIYLKGNETLHIPFKLQCFNADGSTPELGPPHPLDAKNTKYLSQSLMKDTEISSKAMKVSFVTIDQKPIAVLSLQVEMHPHSIDQTFRFSNAEQSFLKKSIRLPPWRNLTASIMTDGQTTSSVIARCTDPHVVCETYDMQEGEPADVMIKVPCGPSPSIRRFIVFIYADIFCATPSRIWQFYVHSLQRIDVTATQGQPSSISVVLRGTQSSRLVKCFASHPDELKVAPADPFMLMANTVQEIKLTASPSAIGNKQMFVNVVDVEFHQLVKSWLICVTSKAPYVSKTFEVQLKCGGGRGSNKSITYTNPYPMKKTFQLKSNRQDLLRFRDNAIMLGSGQTHKIVLEFLPQQYAGTIDVLVFINDKEGKNEETFCVKATYTP